MNQGSSSASRPDDTSKHENNDPQRHAPPSARDLVAMAHRTEDGRITQANDSFLRMVGYTQEEVRSGQLTWRAITSREGDAREREAMDEAVESGGCMPYERVYVAKDGRRVRTISGLSLLRASQAEFVVYAVDLTDRIEASERLQQQNEELEVMAEELRLQNDELLSTQHLVSESRLRYKELFEFAPDGYLITNPAGVIVETNQAASALLGQPPDKLAGRPVSAFVAIEQRPAFRDWVLGLHNATGISEREFAVASAANEPRDVVFRTSVVHDEQGQATGLRWMLRDITERNQREQALRESEARYSAMFVSNHAVMLLIDPNTLRVVDANPAASAYYGYSHEALLGMRIADINVLPEADVRAAVTRAEAEGLRHQEFRHRLASGEVRDVEVYSGAIPLHGGTYLHSIVHDITDRKHAERRLAEKLEIAQRLQGISTQLIQTDDVEALYEAILDTAAAIMRADFASMQTFHPERGDSGELHLLAHRGFSPEAASFWEWVPHDGQSSCAAALRGGERVIVRDVEAGDSGIGGQDLVFCRELGIRAMQTTPLHSRSGALLGMISTHWREPHEPTDPELRAMDVLARQAADVIDRTRAERARRASEARMRRLADSSTFGLLILNNRGETSYVNPMAVTLLGYTEEEYTSGQVLWRHLTPPEYTEADADALRHLQTTGTCKPFEKELIAKDGRRIPVLVGGSVLSTTADGGMEIAAFVTDLTAIKQAQAEAQEKERILEALMDYIPEGITIADAPDVHIRMVSRHGQELAGRPAELIEGIPYTEHAQTWGLYHLDGVTPYANEALPLTRATLHGEVVRNEELILRRPDGTDITILCNAGPIRDAEGNIVAGVIAFRDTTQMRQAREALRETAEAVAKSERRFREVLDSSRDAIYRYDLLNDRYDYVSPAIEALSGYTAAEVVAMGPHGTREMYHPDDLPVYLAHMQALSESTEPAPMDRVQFRWRTKWGEYRWFENSRRVIRDEAGRQVAHVGIIRDISEQKQAENTLRESEERYRTLFESIDEGFCVIEVLFDAAGRPADYRFLEVNPAFEVQTGLHDAAGKRMREMQPRHEEYWFETYGRIARTGQPERFENQAKYLGGRWYDVYAFRVGTPEQHRVAILFSDITHHRQAEQALRDLNENLERRVAQRTALAEQRADQLRRLASELTDAEQRERRRLAQLLHDHLQQLMVGAKINLGMLQTRLQDGDLRAALQQVDDLLSQSIEASRSLTVELSPPVLYEAGLVPALHWLARWMQGKHGLEVTLNVDEEVSPQAEDLRVLLFQSVRELLFNVVKHAGVQRAMVELRRRPGGYVEVTVADDGDGFDVTQQPSSENSGFGLFSIGERLELLGGQLVVESEPEHGTRVTLMVPLYEGRKTAQAEAITERSMERPRPQREAPARLRHARRPARPGIVRVLLADDHQIVRDGLAGLLAAEPDIEVVGQAADGTEAVALAVQLRPDVVVMDVTMPVLNGIEATRRIRAELPETQVIGLSMHNRADMASAMQAAGATAYLTKGGPPHALIGAIRACCAGGDGRGEGAL